ncbi:MAG: acetolactate decarboxylase [Cytophagales bacterium]|nr:acetolactate decarboxylase [Cytophagales bacterium]
MPSDPYGKMQGEITVLDGKPMIAQVQEDGSASVSQTWKAEAPFLVYANVTDWVQYEVKANISNVNDIQNVVQQLAKQKGYDVSRPFPFRIITTITELTTHVVTPRSADVVGYQQGRNQANYTYQNTSGELMGFYSEKHQGIYTHKDSYIHVHFISSDYTQMGHVDKIAISNATLTIQLPAKSQATGALKIKTNDTDFSKGRLGHLQEVSLDDVVKFHGHLCDGLVIGFLGLKEALLQLYPDGIVDRTNTRIVSNPSPCLTDVGVYLAGGRYQFNTFYVQENLNAMYIVERIDNHIAVKVKLKSGVKPAAIDSLGSLANQKKLSACSLDELKLMEDQFSEKLLVSNPAQIYQIEPLKDFKWKPILKNSFVKTDVLNKDSKQCK